MKKKRTTKKRTTTKTPKLSIAEMARIIQSQKEVQDRMHELETRLDRKLTTIATAAAKSESRVWVTRDGQPIQMTDMDEGHLRNTISYVQRRLSQALNSAVYLSTTEKFCQQFVYLLQEAKRRGISV